MKSIDIELKQAIKEAVKKAWEKAAKKLPMQGQREWENFFLRADAAAKTARA